MKKDSIVKEYANIPVSGVYNMKEKSNMLCSKMMDIEDTVRISYNFAPGDFVTSAGVSTLNATNIITLTSLLNMSYTFAKEKAITSVYLDKSQTKLDTDTLTKWVFAFDSIFLLREYLYSEIYTLNPQSPFRQIPVHDIPGNKINTLCYDYIDSNIMDRYRLKEFILWTSYHELKKNIVSGSGFNSVLNPVIPLLFRTPVYSINAIPNTNAETSSTTQSIVDTMKETIATKQYNDGLYEISYKQTKSSQYYTFVWYYDAIYERI